MVDYERLNIIDFKNVDGLARNMINILDAGCADNLFCVSVYAKREFIQEVLGKLLPYLEDKFTFEHITFSDRDVAFNVYRDEYCLFITKNELGKFELSVDFARTEDGTVYCIDDEICFLYQEDCRQDLIEEALECEDEDSRNICFLFGLDENAKESVEFDVTENAESFVRAYSDIIDKMFALEDSIIKLGNAVLGKDK